MEITFHRLGYGSKSVPAVNVKNHKGIDSIPLPLEEFSPLFTHKWIGDNEKDINLWWEEACFDGWERLGDIAREVYGDNTLKVYSLGRSSGWAYIGGLKAFKDWEEEDLKKWTSFSEQALVVAKDIPYQTIALIYYNVFLPLKEEEEEKLNQFRVDLQNQLDAQIGCEA